MISLIFFFTVLNYVSGQIFEGFPASNWTTADTVCSLPSKQDINHDAFLNLTITKGEKRWTGSKVKYSKWVAFIGCDRTYSQGSDDVQVKSVKACALYCSEKPMVLYFKVQTSYCKCFTGKPTATTETLECRKKCQDSSASPCGSDTSAMVFSFVEDLSIPNPEKYIEHECVKSNYNYAKFTVVDCMTTLKFGCKNDTGLFKALTWYDYQEFCLEQIQFVSLGNNLNTPESTTWYWTPIFRVQSIVKDTGFTKGQKCLTVDISMKENMTFSAENCSDSFPFLCSKSGKRKYQNDGTEKMFPRFITLPISVVGAAALIIIILLLIIVIIASKLLKMKKSYEVKIRKLNERLAGSQFSTYNGLLQDDNRENDMACYKQLECSQEDNSSNNYEEAEGPATELNQQEDREYQGYLLPDHHYHMIEDNHHRPIYTEASVHYSNTDLVESGNNDYDEHGYLEPVQK